MQGFDPVLFVLYAKLFRHAISSSHSFNNHYSLLALHRLA